MGVVLPYFKPPAFKHAYSRRESWRELTGSHMRDPMLARGRQGWFITWHGMRMIHGVLKPTSDNLLASLTPLFLKQILIPTTKSDPLPQPAQMSGIDPQGLACRASAILQVSGFILDLCGSIDGIQSRSFHPPSRSLSQGRGITEEPRKILLIPKDCIALLSKCGCRSITPQLRSYARVWSRRR